MSEHYTCALAGLAIPLSSWSLRRDGSGHALTLVTPAYDLAEAIIAGLGEPITLIQTGVSVVSAPLEGVRLDRGASSFSLTLTARSEALPDGGMVQALTGISYRAVSGGLRRVRCAVDLDIEPGDTCDLGGGETLVVAELTARADAASAVMELAGL